MTIKLKISKKLLTMCKKIQKVCFLKSFGLKLSISDKNNIKEKDINNIHN